MPPGIRTSTLRLVDSGHELTDVWTVMGGNRDVSRIPKAVSGVTMDSRLASCVLDCSRGLFGWADSKI